MTKSIVDRISNGDYQSKLPQPAKLASRPKLPSNHTAKQAHAYACQLMVWESNATQFDKMTRDHLESQRKLMKQLTQDIADEEG